MFNVLMMLKMVNQVTVCKFLIVHVGKILNEIIVLLDCIQLQLDLDQFYLFNIQELKNVVNVVFQENIVFTYI